MKPPKAPNLDQRRAADFAAEMQARARAWIADWGLEEGERDFGQALLEIAARFNSEVAERLDGAGEKMRRGFLDWLAVRGEAARPARLPVVFKLNDAAQTGVLASAPIRVQADAAGSPVIFETENDIRIVPGQVAVVVGVDATSDAYYLPPPGLSDLIPLETLPVQWSVKSFASINSTKLQLEPTLGLAVDMVLDVDNVQYSIREVDDGLVTLDRELENPVNAETKVTRVQEFIPFGGHVVNSQNHSLYIGDFDLLNIESDAEIQIVGAMGIPSGVQWDYWGKLNGKDEVKWQRLSEKKAVSDAIVLAKQKGSIEPREINGRNSRWIRASTKNIEAQASPITFESLQLRVNCTGDREACQSSNMSNDPPAEAMTNNTPLVLSEPFYPLGQVPVQFDTFYLGCVEAFSKKGANAKVCFSMSDATCQGYAVVTIGLYANKALAGIGKDGALYLFKLEDGELTRLRGPLRPPQPSAKGETDQTTPLNLNDRCLPVIIKASNEYEYSVVVASGDSIWLWHENADQTKPGGWSLHSKVGGGTVPSDIIEDIILWSNTATSPNAVLFGKKVWTFGNSKWTQRADQVDKNQVDKQRDYVALTSVYNASGELTDSMVAVTETGQVFRLNSDGSESNVGGGADTKSDLNKKNFAIRPAAILVGSEVKICAVRSDRTGLILLQESSASDPVHIDFTGGRVAAGREIGCRLVDGDFQFFIGAKNSSSAFVVSFAAQLPEIISTWLVTDAPRSIAATPMVIGDQIVVPGDRGDAFVARIQPTVTPVNQIIQESILIDSKAFNPGDFLSVKTESQNSRKEWEVKDDEPSLRGNEALYLVSQELNGFVANTPELIGYRKGEFGKGKKTDKQTFKIEPFDSMIKMNDVLRIEVEGKEVVFGSVSKVDSGSKTITVRATLPGSNGRKVTYWRPTPRESRLKPAFEAPQDLKASLVEQGKFVFASPIAPSNQSATCYGVDQNDHPRVVALDRNWTSRPLPQNAPTTFTIQFNNLSWRHELIDTASNPALSWEYWNGKGWWSLDVSDATQRLARSGALSFVVPADIAESDWGGKTNYWIRTRLVGGDYGREEVNVFTFPATDPVTQAVGTVQTVNRSTAKVRAPLVLGIQASYSICKEMVPTFVQVEDSGTLRDQSDANRTDGAIVEAFTPISVMLNRLSPDSSTTLKGTNVETTSATNGEAARCCGQAQGLVIDIAGLEKAPDAAGPLKIDRSIFVGLDAIPSEAPVNLLLLVDERDHKDFAPMRVEVLIADRFEPLVVNDATRALGETGIVSMSFAIPPTRSELFGHKNLTWLRFIPKSANKNWKPTIHGAYLNAVWASATESLTRELLGSSNGEPNLTLHLARPPVLHHTLELRVKEPLGDEERQALVDQDPQSVLSTVEQLPGDWVLWSQVNDPDDESAEARAYALDESTGEIRFGDGVHGRIPPIGRDSIVAFRYCRTEPDSTGGENVPANTIAPRTILNLVSPVDSVESVVAADQAAGGAPPESDDRVLRFGFARLRHRNRAVTLQDLEALTLQSSPEIVQARAFARRGTTHVVVVMRGRTPQPTAAQIRELHRLLLDVSPMSLSATGALRITGPQVRRLRVELELLVDTLDHAGALAAFIKQRLSEFLDAAVGGVDGDGWTLGLKPSEEDIALALVDAPYLLSFLDIKLREITEDGQTLPNIEKLRATELVMLADDPIRITFQTAEVTA